ncbi:MAG TPA: DUF1893 domain-containing protein [bacterium]|nr:DUF1893 domain-containing protein [bacterium]
MKDWQEKIADLQRAGLTLRVEKAGREIFSSSEPMLRPLLLCLQQRRSDMAGAAVIDKIVGRAAAYLCVKGKVAEVITPLASHGAQEVLQQAGIPLHALRVVAQIMNRDNTGPCPMEQLAGEALSADGFYQALCTRIAVKTASD